jgi:hypothetical protein
LTGTLVPPGGNPTALAASVDRYEATEQAIANAADELMRVVMDGQSTSIDALNEGALTASRHLSQAHGRYQGTRSALRAYTVELVTFHAAANAAIDWDHAARSASSSAHQDLTDAAHEARSAAMNPQDQATIDHWEVQAHLARHRCGAADDAMATARAEYENAAETLEEAAQRAIALIDASFDGTNDSRLEVLRSALASVASFLSSLASWVADFFEAAFEAVMEAIAIVVAAVLVAIAAVALIALLVVVIAYALVVIVEVLALVLTALNVLLLVGATAYRVASELGVDDLTRIRIVLAALAIACPPLGYFILGRISNELMKPAPEVKKLNPVDVGDERKSAAHTELEATVPDTLGDFLAQAGAVDTIGGDAQTVVDVAKIVHEDGSVSWIVTLPSTKDWVVPSDAGAVNDLDADLLLLAFPGLQSQYEKAVLDAMAQAGVGDGEPVLVTGWSLGGIMAGHLAEEGAGGYDYAGVVVAGAPIDHMNISADIPVVQVKHTTDPVHRADMIDDPPDQGSHISLWDGDRSGIGLDYKVDMMGHNATQYRETLEEHVTANEAINDNFQQFFVVDDPSHTGQPTIEHAQYAFSE